MSSGLISTATDERIHDALETAVASGEVGIQVAAYVHDEPFVDAWIGRTSEDQGSAVDGDTLFSIFSVSKAVTAMAVHVQAERGLVAYDEPVATYWPEYGTKGKEVITVRQIMSHRAGVPQMPTDLTPERVSDWQWIIDRLVDMEPVFSPGTRNAYQIMSTGWILGEVVRRTDPQHRPFPSFVREEICGPLGMDSFWLGLPTDQEHRVATLSSATPPPVIKPGSLMAAALPEAMITQPAIYNRPDVRSACVPGAGGITNARSLVRFYAMLANRGTLQGTSFLSPDRVLSFLAPRPGYEAIDDVSGVFRPLSWAGFYLDAMGVVPPVNPGRRLLYSIGAGSSFACADVDSGLAFAICHNRMAPYRPGQEGPFWPIAGAVRAVASEVNSR